MRISDWSSDVCSSDLFLAGDRLVAVLVIAVEAALLALLLARLRRGGRRGGDPFARCGCRSWRDDAVARARAFIAPEQHRKHSQGQRKPASNPTPDHLPPIQPVTARPAIPATYGADTRAPTLGGPSSAPAHRTGQAPQRQATAAPP